MLRQEEPSHPTPSISPLCCWLYLLLQGREAVIPAGSLCGVCLAGIKPSDPGGFSVPQGLITQPLPAAVCSDEFPAALFSPCPNPCPQRGPTAGDRQHQEGQMGHRRKGELFPAQPSGNGSQRLSGDILLEEMDVMGWCCCSQCPCSCCHQAWSGSQGSLWQGGAGHGPFFPCLSLPGQTDNTPRSWIRSLFFLSSSGLGACSALEVFPVASQEPGEFVSIPCRRIQAEIPAAVMAGRLQRGQTLTRCGQEDFVPLLGLRKGDCHLVCGVENSECSS